MTSTARAISSAVARVMSGLLILLLALFGGASATASVAVTAANGSSGYVCDVPAIARVEAVAPGTSEADPVQLSDAREGSAPPFLDTEVASTTPGLAVVATNTAGGWLDDAATAKVPSGWGPGAANKKGVGTRWTDPGNQGNGVRIDQGNPLNPQATQQVDHVVVRYNGRVIGRDGQPITGSIDQNFEQAHIPLTEWQTWGTWFAP